MAKRPKGFRRWLVMSLTVVVAVLVAAGYVWRDDIQRTALDPKVPFQTYQPPPAPNYAMRASWYLLPNPADAARPSDPPADIFFVSPTTYDGGAQWNAPIDDDQAERLFRRTMAPNYAGPFVRVGRLFAPRYRQASLYTLLTLRDDARDARAFAYRDVAAAFRQYRDEYNNGRPFIVVGVEQGGTLAERLIAEEIAPDERMRRLIAAAYLIDTAVPAGEAPLPPCTARGQPGCLAAWTSVREGDLEGVADILNRSLVWDRAGQLVNLNGRRPMCFNPLLGKVSDEPAPARLNLGAANATGLEWGARPPFMTRQVTAVCKDGVLRVSRPKSTSLRRIGSWADRRKAPGYNLFYGDLEADAKARLAALTAEPDFPKPGAATAAAQAMADHPLRRID
ncbi:DUF3089 domain-containing protein [Phenylobacterium sp.]|uniref:DUF3089 domain-containing protein n=1 Tax=Phenylobacterium sp. TaxID=1871053 RepID=UPI0035B17B81